MLATPHGHVIAIDKRQVAGNVTADLLNGGQYQLAADAGNVVLLNYFGTWCGPCAAEAPQLDALYRERKAAGVRFVGVDIKDGSEKSSRAWLAAKEISYPVLWDQPGKTVLQLGHTPGTGLPVSVLVDRHSRIAAVYVGAILPADLAPALDALVGEA